MLPRISIQSNFATMKKLRGIIRKILFEEKAILFSSRGYQIHFYRWSDHWGEMCVVCEHGMLRE
jgi:hypothetical protein